MPMTPYPPMRERPATIQREFRGINKLDAFSIADAYATDGRNFSTSEYPCLSTRQGYSLLSASYGLVTGLSAWKDTQLVATFADGSMRRWNGSSWDSIASGLTTAPFSFCNFKGGFSDISLIAANGNSVKLYSGSSVTNLSGAPAGLNFIEQYADRVFGCVGNTLRGSGWRNATDWTSANPAGKIDDSVSFFGEIENNTGETINAMKAGLGRLVIFKPSSMYELQGYTPNDYRVDPISTSIGVLNNRCIAVLKSGMYFLDDNGIYLYRGDGVTPSSDFSKPVQKYIDAMNLDAKETFSVATDGKLLYVSIALASSHPDTLLVFDPDFQTWSVWDNFSTVCSTIMGGKAYFGDYDGSVRLLGGLTDGGAAIEGSWVSKPYTGASMAQILLWTRANLTLDLAAGGTFTVYLSTSAYGDDWIQAGEVIAGSTAIQRKAVYFKSSISPPTEQIRVKFEWTGKMKLYEFSRVEHTRPLR